MLIEHFLSLFISLEAGLKSKALKKCKQSHYKSVLRELALLCVVVRVGKRE